MDGNWDFYFARVDGQPASIYLDLGVVDDIPLAGYPFMGQVRIWMRAPREDGLSSQQEFDALIALEDRLVPALCEDRRARFVGRNTSAGFRDFFFFVGEGVEWADSVRQALDGTEYRFEAGQLPDPEGRLYLDFLYPDDEALQRIGNRRLCEAMQNAGDPLSAPRELLHRIRFVTESSVDAFLIQASAMGFRPSGEPEFDPDLDEWQVGVRRDDIPGFDRIDAICIPLFHAAQDLGGCYDGWESVVVDEQVER